MKVMVFTYMAAALVWMVITVLYWISIGAIVPIHAIILVMQLAMVVMNLVFLKKGMYD